MRMHVGDHAMRGPVFAVLGVHALVEACQVLLEQGGEEEWLDGGTRLIGRCEGRDRTRDALSSRGHGQELSGPGVGHEYIATRRPGLIQRGLQGRFRDRLPFDERGSHPRLWVVGRMADGVTLDQVRADLGRISADIAAAVFPDDLSPAEIDLATTASSTTSDCQWMRCTSMPTGRMSTTRSSRSRCFSAVGRSR